MSYILQIQLVIFSLSMIIVVLYIVNRGKITIKYSLIWLFAGIIMLISASVPRLIERISDFLGFQVPSNLVFFIFIGFLVILTLSLTAIVSGQREKITLLIQEVSLLKKKLEDVEQNVKKIQ